MIQTAAVGVMQRPVVRQFVKFCIIGFSSMIIDVGVAYVLTYRLPIHMYWAYARTISVILAATNGFIWNSMWTFRGMGSGARHEMYAKFMIVNAIGLALNLAIMRTVLFIVVAPHQILHQPRPDKFSWSIAMGFAVVIVSLWNFVANKKWTYAG
jgi:putative flippase GtrA